MMHGRIPLATGKSIASVVLGVIGALAVAILLSRWMLELMFRLVGGGWMIAFRHQLLDWGVSPDFVLRFTSFAALHFPQWAVAAIIGLALGLLKSRRAHGLAFIFAVAVPLGDVVLAVWFESSTLLNVRIRLISCLGVLVVLLGWLAGYVLCGRRYPRKGSCPVCGYDRRGTRASACPECGNR